MNLILVELENTIKKYLHGQQIEADLAANRISVTGSKNNLQYNFTGSLSVFAADGQDATRELILQYRLLDKQGQPVNNQNQGWTHGKLPDNVPANVQKIEVQVIHNPAKNSAQAIFVYGPEGKNNQAKATIDLSQIALVD